MQVDDFDVSLLCMFLSLEWEEEDGTVDRVLDDEAKVGVLQQLCPPSTRFSLCV